MNTVANSYAARLEIEYPEAADRLTSAFRFFTVIPILIVLGTITGGSFQMGGWNDMAGDGATVAYGSVGILFLPVLLLILFRGKYPKWWFDWNLALTRFSLRVGSYALLLRHEYPSTDEEQAVHVELDYPDVSADLSRGLPLVKWFLAIPHYIVLFFLGIAVFFVTIFAWFAILFTGKYPRGLFDFVVGVMRWTLRVEAYAFILITDKYPPFSLD